MDVVALGAVLGLGAGLAPGPLLALVVAATLERGVPAGARVAVAPLLTDAPIVVLCTVVLGSLSADVLTGLSLAGAAFVGHLAVDALRGRAAVAAGGPGRVLRRAAIVNALSPHPWLFWIAVGGPLLVDAAGRGALLAAGFLAAFYGPLVGTKLVVAGLVGAGRGRSWRRAVPARARRAAAPAIVARLGGARLASAALLAAAALGLLADGLARA